MKDKKDCILPDREVRHGEWEPEEEYTDRLYGIYKTSLIDHRPTFMTLPVRVRDYETEKFSGKRFFEDSRGERIPWISELIINTGKCCDIKVFKRYNEKSKKDRIYIWCEILSYVVVLENREDYFFLVTAFIVNAEKAKDFERYYKRGRYKPFDVYLEQTKTPS
jgi:hypothetical protein